MTEKGNGRGCQPRPRTRARNSPKNSTRTERRKVSEIGSRIGVVNRAATIEQLAELSGSRRVEKHARGLLVQCPSPSHDDEQPSCSLIYGEAHEAIAVCHGCGLRTDAVGFVGKVLGLPLHGRRFGRTLEAAERVIGLSNRGTHPLSAPMRPRRARPAKRERQPPRAFAEFYCSLRLVDEVRAVSEWLVSRGLDVGAVLDADVCRAIHEAASIPPCAMTRGKRGPLSWRDSGHLVVLPTFDATGRLVGVRARRVFDVPGGDRKEVSPRGGVDGVYACPLARQILKRGLAPPIWRQHGDRSDWLLIVREGGPDFLESAAAAKPHEAVMGIFSGAWTPEIAARVPDGTTVLCRVDLDEAGRRYARKVWLTLHDRCHVAVPKEFLLGKGMS